MRQLIGNWESNRNQFDYFKLQILWSGRLYIDLIPTMSTEHIRMSDFELDKFDVQSHPYLSMNCLSEIPFGIAHWNDIECFTVVNFISKQLTQNAFTTD